MGKALFATEASVGGEPALRGAVAEAPQCSLAQGGGEGHQTVSGGSAHVVGSFFGGPRAASDGHSAAGFKSASSTPPRTP